jgi:hypothetical protein
MSDDYLWDRKGAPDPDVAKLEQLLAPLASRDTGAPLDELRPRRRRTWWIVGGVVAAAAAVAIVLALPRRGDAPAPATGFDFVAREGTALWNSRVTAVGTLATGDVLDTGGSHVELKIADIGRAELSPATRVRLERSDATGRHLAIDRGKLHAKVSAPPRLFVVSTPSARVVDLGCEYTIEVDATGAGHIEVQRGQVELATRNGAIVVAPAGTHAQILPGSQPGLPIADGASDEVERAVAAYLAGGPIDALLAAATRRDAITLVDLATVDTVARRAALARLAELVPPPPGVSVEGAAADDAQLARWRDQVVAGAFAPPGKSHKAKSP